MKYFFSVEENIPDGVGFDMFSQKHIVWIILCAVLCAALCFAYCRKDSGRRSTMRVLIGCAILLCEILRLANIIAAGTFSVYYLPLHLCGLAVFFTFYHCIAGGDTVANFLYSTCMPGALFAIVFPDWTAFPAFSYHCILGFVVHTLIVAYPLMQVIGGDIKPSVKYLPRCFGILLALAAPIYILDRVFRANYMFLLAPAAGSPLEWFAHLLGIPGYLLGYIPMLIIIWSLLYIPFRSRKVISR